MRLRVSVSMSAIGKCAICPDLQVFDADEFADAKLLSGTPTGATASRRWLHSIRRTASRRSAAARICSAAKRR